MVVEIIEVELWVHRWHLRRLEATRWSKALLYLARRRRLGAGADTKCVQRRGHVDLH